MIYIQIYDGSVWFTMRMFVEPRFSEVSFWRLLHLSKSNLIQSNLIYVSMYI